METLWRPHGVYGHDSDAKCAVAGVAQVVGVRSRGLRRSAEVVECTRPRSWCMCVDNQHPNAMECCPGKIAMLRVVLIVVMVAAIVE
jgi:hypothetical protein